MKYDIEIIGPDKAKSYLEKIPPYQRKVIKGSVAKLASEMAGGRWILTHQGIAFDEDGMLFDGQHRMHAVIESGASVPMVVFRGVCRESWHSTDIGRKRDLSAISGIEKREVEAYRSACDFAWRHREPSFMHLDLIQKSKLGTEIRNLLLYAPSTKRMLTSAPVRLVCAIWAIKCKSSYPFDQYKALSVSHYHMMSAASQSLCRQVESCTNGTRKITTYDMAARCYKVFDPSKSEMTKIQIADISAITARIGMDIREIVEEQA